ncbi:hypothetical protein SAMD00019534_056180 [Acytostelium subglobosum LB1]|uniref:hypothetical protein n=1 Tax=Acytostelium subglobosum LB1 TaxID=1410327 RepID=UPI000644B584|nr:hypothetical protein SAMD00019534_056180 [Acytostelium subglobosum LB1]GAM22443.1 hypothetical protein SAMD00019534_056180 [Acytostelium subglobosum LB1]|eukprot:XP_012754563.1 hypothetical protein SAMD00019534_056180 [Acytostelium subglobosum LB1]
MPIKKGYAGSAANLAKWREEQRALKEQQQQQSDLVIYDDDDDDHQLPIEDAKPIVIEAEKPKAKPTREYKPRVNKTDALDKKLDELMAQFSTLSNSMQKAKEVAPEPIIAQTAAVPTIPIAQQQQQQQQQVRPPLKSDLLKHRLLTKF